MDIPGLLERLDLPRENGTASLARAQAVLDSCLHAAGLAPEAHPFSCHLSRTDAAAMALGLAALFLAGAAVRGRKLLVGTGVALCLAVAAGSGWLDPLLPANAQANLVVVVPPRGLVQREVLLTAHYDSKTELLDHAGRAVLFGLAGFAMLLATLLVATRRGPWRRAATLAAVALLAVAAQLSLGRFLRLRSHGIVDDAAACVLLVDLAAQLQARPLAGTQVRFVWFAGEEVGAQGSAALAPTLARHAGSFVNLEGIGAGPELAVASLETDGRRLHRATPELVASLAACHDEPLRRLRLPLWTDAGPLRRAGLAGLTVLTLPHGTDVIRGLHGKNDRRSRLSTAGYDKTLRLLQTYLARLDAGSPAQPLHRP